MRRTIALAASAWVALTSAALAASSDKPTAKPETVTKIEAAGATVGELAQNDPRLVVAYHLSLGEKATDEHLKPLAELAGPEIYALNLSGTSITDAGLANLAKLTGLVRLHLEKTQIGDEGLKHLVGLENLEYLNLYGTKVTDAGLEHLKGLKNLKKVFIWQTPVTIAGCEKLQKALPEVAVIPDLVAEKQAAEAKKKAEEAKKKAEEAKAAEKKKAEAKAAEEKKKEEKK
jgi:hypothetical protein